MQELGAISPKEVQAKHRTAALAAQYLKENLPRVKGLDMQSLYVTHSWDADKVARQAADPHAAFTMLIPTKTPVVSLAALLQLRQAVRLVDKSGPSSFQLVSSNDRMYLAVGFYTALRTMHALTDFVEDK